MSMTQAERSRRHRERHPDANRTTQRRFRENHREEIRVKNRELYHADLERQRERNRLYRANNLEKERARCRAYAKANPDKVRAKHLRATYGITIQCYEQALVSQDHRCKICALPWAERTRDFQIDHDHTTGAVRGLLCHMCNKGLGLFRDNPQAMVNAARYVQLGGRINLAQPEFVRLAPPENNGAIDMSARQ